ncbi:hypothetical protein HK101_003566 [Irineochytrium annulatum]|nr:hypothetical protein HK101_003566 [Irineochytrium annulatum]
MTVGVGEGDGDGWDAKAAIDIGFVGGSRVEPNVMRRALPTRPPRENAEEEDAGWLEASERARWVLPDSRLGPSSSRRDWEVAVKDGNATGWTLSFPPVVDVHDVADLKDGDLLISGPIMFGVVAMPSNPCPELPPRPVVSVDAAAMMLKYQYTSPADTVSTTRTRITIPAVAPAESRAPPPLEPLAMNVDPGVEVPVEDEGVGPARAAPGRSTVVADAAISRRADNGRRRGPSSAGPDCRRVRVVITSSQFRPHYLGRQAGARSG